MASFTRTSEQKFRLTTRFEASAKDDNVASNGGVTSASPPVNDNNVVSALTSTSSSGEIVSKSEKDFDDVSSLVRELRHSGVYRNFFCEQ